MGRHPPNSIRKATRHIFLWIAGLMLLSYGQLHADPSFVTVDTDGNGVQAVTLSGGSSFDPDGAIIRYTWRINNQVVGSGDGPMVQNITYDFGLGTTTVLLTVQDDALVTVSTTARVMVLPASSSVTIPVVPVTPSPNSSNLLAGHTFIRTTALAKFSFDPPYKNFSGVTFDAATQTYFVTDSTGDVVLEIQPDGSLLRTIDIAGLRPLNVSTANAEGITWMRGQTFALALHDPKEIVVVDIPPGVTSVSRAQAKVYGVSSGPGKPRGLTYVPREDAFYWVAKDGPKAVVKAQIVGGQWQTIWSKTVDNLPVDKLADIAFFPKLSPYLFLISESTPVVMEVDMSGPTAELKSSLSLEKDSIPQAGGLTFGPDGSLVVVGKHGPGTQIDLSVYTPSPIVGNQPPWIFANVPLNAYGDGAGHAYLRVDASASYDPENDAITRYRWTLDNGSIVYDGPHAVETLVLDVAGSHVLNLDVFSQANSVIQSRRVSYTVLISLEPSAVGTSPLPPTTPAVSLNYIHPGSTERQVQFVFHMTSGGHAEVRIFDPLGREVKKLMSDEVPAGSYLQPWDLTNENGSSVSSGVYFAVIKTPGQTNHEKVVVVR